MILFGLLIPWGSTNKDPTSEYTGRSRTVNNTGKMEYNRAGMEGQIYTRVERWMGLRGRGGLRYDKI